MKPGGNAIRPLLQAAAGWVLMGAAICAGSFKPEFGIARELALFLATTLFVLGDLFSTGMLFSTLLEVTARNEKNDKSFVLQAFYWATIKLGCLTLLVLLFLRVPTLVGIFGTVHDGGAAREFLRRPGLLAGIATFVIVPLAGGLIWHRQVNRGSQ